MHHACCTGHAGRNLSVLSISNFNLPAAGKPGAPSSAGTSDRSAATLGRIEGVADDLNNCRSAAQPQPASRAEHPQPTSATEAPSSAAAWERG